MRGRERSLADLALSARRATADATPGTLSQNTAPLRPARIMPWFLEDLANLEATDDDQGVSRSSSQLRIRSAETDGAPDWQWNCPPSAVVNSR